jgi:DNA-binding MarR family transcriptional regulator
MKLEEAIQQKRFVHEWQKATINIIYTSNWLEGKIKKNLKKHQLTVQQYNVLRILRGQSPEPITTSVIRERMLDKMSDASRIVDRLAKKDLLIRTTCPTDKRLVDIVISEKGLELLAVIDLEKEQMEFLLNNLTQEEAETLNMLLDKARKRNSKGCCPEL